MVEDISISPSFLTLKTVLLALPTFKEVVAEVVPTPTTSNLLEGVVVPMPTCAFNEVVASKNKQGVTTIIL